VKAYYSWKVQNPNEALYDDMVEVDAGDRSTSVHIDWNDEAERNARSVTVAGSSKQTLEAPLYGAVVGVDDGKNEFTLSYVDSAVVHTGHLLSLLAASVVLVCNNFVQLA